MAEVSGMTKAKMLEIYNASIVAARRVANQLIMTTRGGVDIPLGEVVKGDPGEVTDLTIGTVDTGTPAATITGTAPNKSLNLTLPLPAPAASLDIGTVTEGSAAATITGEVPAQTLNLTLPRGIDGNNGSLVGTIIPYPSNTIPNGWLLCDGAAFIAADYPLLAAVLGTTYGGTVQNPCVPNLMGRVPAGKHSGVADFDTLGEMPGEYAHTLTIPEMPTHSHNLSMFDGNQHDYLAGSAESYGIAQVYNPATAIAGPISNTGGGVAHNVVQPTTIVNFIIKAVTGVDSPPPVPTLGNSVNGLDMNNVTDTGFYHGYAMTNSAVTAISTFEVIKYSPDWIVQKQYVLGANLGVVWDNSWIRSRYNGTTWSPWEKTNKLSDTGWMSVSVAASFTGVAAPNAPECRIRGGVVYYRGAITGDFPAAVTVTIGTAPIQATYYPDDSRGSRAISDWSGYATYGAATGNGSLRVFYPAAVTRTINLAGFGGYPLNYV